MGIFKTARPVLGRFAYLAGIFLLVSGIATSFTLVGKADLDGGAKGFRKVAATVKSPAGNSGTTGNGNESLSEYQRNTICTRLGNVPVAFTAGMQPSTVYLEAAKSGCMAVVTGVDRYYSEFHRIDLLVGSFLSAQNETGWKDAIVIEDTIAWDIFKTLDAVGRTITLSDHKFTVIGVIQKDTSIIGRLTDDGIPQAFIPLKSLLEIGGSTAVTGFEAATPGSETLDKYRQEVSAALQAAGKNPQSYTITDYNIQGAILGQKPYLAVFAVGFPCILLLLAIICKTVYRMGNLFRQGLQTGYFMDVLKEKSGVLAAGSAKAAATAFSAAAVWRMIAFKPYIPPAFLPDSLIDLAYYSDLWKSAIRNAMASLGYIPTLAEIGFAAADRLLMWILCITVPLGTVLFFMGLAVLRDHGHSAANRAVTGAAVLMGSVALQLPICALLGLKPSIGLQQLLLLGIFVFLFSIREIFA